MSPLDFLTSDQLANAVTIIGFAASVIGGLVAAGLQLKKMLKRVHASISKAVEAMWARIWENFAALSEMVPEPCMAAGHIKKT